MGLRNNHRQEMSDLNFTFPDLKMKVNNSYPILLVSLSVKIKPLDNKSHT